MPRKSPYPSKGRATVVGKIKHETLMAQKDKRIKELTNYNGELTRAATSDILKIRVLDDNLTELTERHDRMLAQFSREITTKDKQIERDRMTINAIIGYKDDE